MTFNDEICLMNELALLFKVLVIFVYHVHRLEFILTSLVLKSNL